MSKQLKIAYLEKQIKECIDKSQRLGVWNFRALIAEATRLNKKLRTLKNK